MTTTLQTSDTTAVPESVGPYTLQELIYETEGTLTYLANTAGAPNEGEPCIVKVLRPEWLNDEPAVKDFQQDAKILLNLRHPNVIPGIKAGRVSGLPYIALEYFKGVPLGRLMSALAQKNERLPIDIGLVIARDIVTAMCYVHKFSGWTDEQTSIIIQGLGLDSVFLCFDGHTKLLSFSDAALRPYELTCPGKWTRFTAPELIVPGRTVDQRADIYSAGALLFELSTNKKLISWHSLTPAITSRIFRNLHPLPSDVYPELSVLDATVDKALQCDPEKRYQTAGELLDDLQNILDKINATCSTDEVRNFTQQSCATLLDGQHLTEQRNEMGAVDEITKIASQHTPR